MPTSPMLTGAGATGLRIVQLRPAFSSWGLGVGKKGGKSGFFYSADRRNYLTTDSLNTFGRIKPIRRQDFVFRASYKCCQR